MHTVENQLGFICLTDATDDDRLITIKVNKIVAVVGHPEMGCSVCTPNDSFWVKETVSEVIGQIQNVNPNMR